MQSLNFLDIVKGNEVMNFKYKTSLVYIILCLTTTWVTAENLSTNSNVGNSQPGWSNISQAKYSGADNFGGMALDNDNNLYFINPAKNNVYKFNQDDWQITQVFNGPSAPGVVSFSVATVNNDDV